MGDIYGPLRKAPLSFALFAVPALIFIGGGIALGAQEAGSVAAAFGTPTVMITGVLSLAILIWGAVFTSKPVATLTAEAIILPNGQSVLWEDVTDAQEGQTTTSVASANTGPRSVVHEVVRLQHRDGEVTKVVTTWAKIGPQAANDRILAAYAQR